MAFHVECTVALVYGLACY